MEEIFGIKKKWNDTDLNMKVLGNNLNKIWKKIKHYE